MVFKILTNNIRIFIYETATHQHAEIGQYSLIFHEISLQCRLTDGLFLFEIIAFTFKILAMQMNLLLSFKGHRF